MEIPALVVAFILLIILFRQTYQLREGLEEANRQIRLLRKSRSATVSSEAPPQTDSETEAIPSSVSDPPWVEAPPVKLEVPAPKPPTAAASSPQSFFQSERWKRKERFILENLTGILGTLGVVLGLGFLGVYTALMMEPVFRVILLAAVSLVIAGVSGYYLRKAKWRGLAQWTQSAGFAVFLLACLGSGGIPGLQWVSDPLLAWGLLTTGVAANLGLAYVRRSPLFASVHAVLSFTALAVAGPSPIIVATMGVLAVGSLLLIRGKAWEVHLAITESVFFGLLLLFYFTGPAPDEVLRLVATTGILAVFVVGQATHYQKCHAGSAWDTSAVLTHLLAWGLTCAGLFVYAPQYEQLLAPCLLFVSLSVGFIARQARRRGILWLYKIDTLFSLGSAFGAALALVAWELALTPAVLLALVVSLAFTLLMILEGERRLARVGTRTTEILSLVVAALSVSGADALALGTAALLLGVFQAIVVHRLKSLAAPPGLYDLILPWLLVTAALVLSNGQISSGLPSGYGLFLPLVGLFVWHRVRSSRLLNLGLLTATVGYSLIQWGKLFLGMLFGPQDGMVSLLVAVPMVLIPLAGVLVVKHADKALRGPLLALFGINFALAAFLVLWPVSPIGIPLAWLVLGLTLIWAPTVKSGVLDKELTVLGLSLVVAGLLISGPLVLGSQAAAPLRWGIEGLIAALLLGMYWTRTLRQPTGEEALDGIPPTFLEVSLLVLFITAAVEVPTPLLPTVLGVASTALLVLLFRKNVQRRLFIHSYWGFLLSAVLMVWVAVTRTGGPEFWLTALVQTLWLVLIFRRTRPGSDDFPRLLRWLHRISTPILHRLPLFTVIPLGISWAVSLGFSFDSTLLTLLWSLESFGIFLLALILKEPLFRLLSLSALGVCLVRLVFFDLIQADTLSRALVFLGVGLLLILMNILYTRFKGRVSQGDETP